MKGKLFIKAMFDVCLHANVKNNKEVQYSHPSIQAIAISLHIML